MPKIHPRRPYRHWSWEYFDFKLEFRFWILRNFPLFPCDFFWSPGQLYLIFKYALNQCVKRSFFGLRPFFHFFHFKCAGSSVLFAIWSLYTRHGTFCLTYIQAHRHFLEKSSTVCKAIFFKKTFSSWFTLQNVRCLV